MSLNDVLRVFAGVMVIVSVLLTHFVDARFIWFTVFIGANLLQSGFTKWCPAIWAFKKLGFK